MELVIAVVMLALIEYQVFSFRVGMARVKYGIRAPATSGHEVFERLFRVQQNTLEQMILFVPSIVAFAWVSENEGWPGHEIAAVLGLLWILGRALYAVSYVKDPATRSVGFLMTFFPTLAMILGTLLCIVM